MEILIDLLLLVGIFAILGYALAVMAISIRDYRRTGRWN